MNVYFYTCHDMVGDTYGVQFSFKHKIFPRLKSKGEVFYEYFRQI